MLRRKSFNHNDVIISHLDDTAIVSYDLGEWGIFYLKLADCILSEATWNSEEDKRKIVDRVITKHNNLRSAYTIISKIEADEKYYSYIRIMATRSEYDDYKYGATRVDEIEYALFGLAGFKKKEDIAFIKQRLLDLNWEIGKTSFNLMKKFPDTTYLGVYEKFYRRAYQTICRKRDYDRAASFIKSVATYKSDRSAAILNLILNNKPSVYCWPDSSYLRNVLVEAIWDNPCAAYINLRKQTQKAGEEYENEKIDPLKLEPNADNTPGQTIWWF
jgi:hypothetical protein